MPTDTGSEINVNKGRLPAPQLNPFREFVSSELRYRSKNYPSPTATPFVKMTSCMVDTTPLHAYKFFTLGLHGYVNDTNIFDPIYSPNREIVGYAVTPAGYQLIDASMITARVVPPTLDNIASVIQTEENNQQFSNTPAGGMHPIPGITDIKIEHHSQGAGIIASITWQCYNRQQLEFLRHHFLMPGNFIVLEWGQQFSDFQLSKTLDFRQEDIGTILANAYVNGRDWVFNEYVYPNNGNYDFIVGTAGTFTTNLEPKTNTYTCTTRIYSSGEYLFGVNTNLTYLDPNNVINISSDFKSYFQNNGGFDDFLNYYLNSSDDNERKLVAKGENTTTADNHDLMFISWRLFMQDLMADLLYTFSNHSSTSSQLNKLLRFSTREFHIVDALAAGTIDANNKAIPWVGSNPNLRSTDIDTCILIKKPYQNDSNSPISTVNAQNYPDLQEFFANGYFDDNAPDRGLLSRGVWINVQKIRESFLNSTSLEQAIRTILIGMNNAVKGYWQLIIYFDNDSYEYKIIDTNFSNTDEALSGKIYRFNTDTEGECLDINLDAVYPKEIMTQLALSATIQSNPIEDLRDINKRYPLYGQTSHYALAMNWSSLTDGLKPIVNYIREAKIEQANQLTVTGQANRPNLAVDAVASVTDETVTARILARRNSNSSPIRTSTNPQPGQSTYSSPTLALAEGATRLATPAIVNRIGTVPAPNSQVASQVEDTSNIDSALSDAGNWLKNYMNSHRNQLHDDTWTFRGVGEVVLDYPTLIRAVMTAEGSWADPQEVIRYMPQSRTILLYNRFGPAGIGRSMDSHDHNNQLAPCNTQENYSTAVGLPFSNLVHYVAVRLAELFTDKNGVYNDNLEPYLAEFNGETPTRTTSSPSGIHFGNYFRATPDSLGLVQAAIPDIQAAIQQPNSPIRNGVSINSNYRDAATQLRLNIEFWGKDYSATSPRGGYNPVTGGVSNPDGSVFPDTAQGRQERKDVVEGRGPKRGFIGHPAQVGHTLHEQARAVDIGPIEVTGYSVSQQYDVLDRIMVSHGWSIVRNDRGHYEWNGPPPGDLYSGTVIQAPEARQRLGYYSSFASQVMSLYRQIGYVTVQQHPFAHSGVLKDSLDQMENINPGSDAVASRLAEANRQGRIAIDRITEKFGNNMYLLIELNPTLMADKIIRHGLENTGGSLVNSFVAPFPTTCSIDITIQGVSGISIWDAFLVSKLPFMYDAFGVFHVLQINEEVTAAGWRTRLRGMFRFMRFTPRDMIAYGESSPEVLETGNVSRSSVAPTIPESGVQNFNMGPGQPSRTP